MSEWFKSNFRSSADNTRTYLSKLAKMEDFEYSRKDIITLLSELKILSKKMN